MSQPIAITRLHAYRGPNIFGPQPGVLLRASCPDDRSRRLRAAIKDGAQAIGLVIAYLEVGARPTAAGHLISARFTTDAPQIGAALCQYLADGLAAEACGDEEWDRDGPLLALQERLRAEALPVAALQVAAEARRRGLPVLRLPTGELLLGYGARSWRLDLSDGVEPPWGQIGRVPLTVVTGAARRAGLVRRCAAELAEAGLPARAIDGADFAAARALLADPATEAAVIGLDSADILRCGLPFDRCDQAVVGDMSGARPSEADDDDEWLRALGLPMLLGDAPVRLPLADPRLRPLVPYAPSGVLDLGEIG
jgi:hypothetical protein